jgi:phosphatidylserine decarboxylase
MLIARDGMPVLLSFVGIHLIFLTGGLISDSSESWLSPRFILFALATLSALLTLFSIYFFRDPEREVPEGENLVVSPADGRILSLDQVEETSFIGAPAQRVSIFMNIFDVHVNRSPIDGIVRFKEYRKGKFFIASLDKSSQANEALTLGIESLDNNHRVLVRQIAGLIARRIVRRVDEFDILKRGERFGMIRYGSRLEVCLPPGSKCKVAPGDRVKAGTSILAELP